MGRIHVARIGAHHRFESCPGLFDIARVIFANGTFAIYRRPLGVIVSLPRPFGQLEVVKIQASGVVDVIASARARSAGIRPVIECGAQVGKKDEVPVHGDLLQEVMILTREKSLIKSTAQVNDLAANERRLPKTYGAMKQDRPIEWHPEQFFD